MPSLREPSYFRGASSESDCSDYGSAAVETAILNIINHQSLIATKTSRIVFAANGDGIMEFGLRRAQGLMRDYMVQEQR